MAVLKINREGQFKVPRIIGLLKRQGAHRRI